MAVLTYGVYSTDQKNITPSLLQAYNTVTVQKILQIALDPLINYAVINAALAWLAVTT
jgi:hypothetical protein